MTRLFAGTEFDIPPTCDRCGKSEQDCACPEEVEKPNYLPPEKQTAKVRVDRRKHKRMVTVIAGLKPDQTDMRDLLSRLKSACGAGGSIQDENHIEIQGDHADRVRSELTQIGYRVR